MKIEFYEKVFLGISLVMLVVFAIFLFVAVQSHGITLAAPTQRVDPMAVLSEAPFNEPGIVEQSPGQYLGHDAGAHVVFRTGEMQVPEGATVTFQVASPDVIHGFKILKTNVNIMVIPGEVSTVTHTFDEPGEYMIVCHEYCGTGHHAMAAKLIVGEGSADGSEENVEGEGS